MLYDVHYMLQFYVRSRFEPGETNLTCVKDNRIIYDWGPIHKKPIVKISVNSRVSHVFTLDEYGSCMHFKIKEKSLMLRLGTFGRAYILDPGLRVDIWYFRYGV